MSSQTLQKPHEFEPAPGLIPDAVGTVAERSFFAFVNAGEDPGYYDSAPEWLVATVKFDDGPVSGSLTCALPSDLALLLFNRVQRPRSEVGTAASSLLDDLVLASSRHGVRHVADAMRAPRVG